MLDFFSKANQRKMRLIRLLSHSSNYVNIKKIANNLNIRERIVQEDIRDLTSSEIGYMFDIEVSSKGYKSRLVPNKSIDAFGHYYLKNNDCFNILESVFFNNNYTIEDLAEIHHSSLPTLYRIIRRINNSFKDRFKLKFRTNPCRLIGDEVEIRSFYIQYFIERYPLTEWPFQDIKRNRLLNMFKTFTTKLNFKLQFSDLRMLELSLAVSHIRCNQGFFLEQRGPRLNAILQAVHHSDELANIFNDVFKGSINPKVFTDNLTYIIQEHFFFNYEEFLKSSSTDEYSARSLIHLSSMLNELSLKHKAPLDNKEALIHNLHNSAQLGIRNVNVRHLIIDNKAMLLKQFKELFPNFYNDMKIKMMTYLEIMELEDKELLLNHLLHNLVTRWEYLLKYLYSTQRKINIRVISSHDIYHAKLMMMLLENEFHDQIDINLIETIDVDELFTNEKIDIFVTNFTFSVPGKNIVAVNDIPTTEDFALISDIINEIRINENNVKNIAPD